LFQKLNHVKKLIGTKAGQRKKTPPKKMQFMGNENKSHKL